MLQFWVSRVTSWLGRGMALCNAILSLSPHLGHHKDYMASISHLCLRNPCNFTGTTEVDCLQVDCFHHSWQAVVINLIPSSILLQGNGNDYFKRHAKIR